MIELVREEPSGDYCEALHYSAGFCFLGRGHGGSHVAAIGHGTVARWRAPVADAAAPCDERLRHVRRSLAAARRSAAAAWEADRAGRVKPNVVVSVSIWQAVQQIERILAMTGAAFPATDEVVGGAAAPLTAVEATDAGGTGKRPDPAPIVREKPPESRGGPSPYPEAVPLAELARRLRRARGGQRTAVVAREARVSWLAFWCAEHGWDVNASTYVRLVAWTRQRGGRP